MTLKDIPRVCKRCHENFIAHSSQKLYCEKHYHDQECDNPDCNNIVKHVFEDLEYATCSRSCTSKYKYWLKHKDDYKIDKKCANPDCNNMLHLTLSKDDDPDYPYCCSASCIMYYRVYIGKQGGICHKCHKPVKELSATFIC